MRWNFLSTSDGVSWKQKGEIAITTIALKRHYQIKGMTFGARKCSSIALGSCTCNPCDCNPCKCGDSVDIPSWRVSGYSIETGSIQDIALSGLLLLSLAQPVEEGKNDRWQEVILVDGRATLEQARTLLEVFEHLLESMPAEVQPQPEVRRAVYTAPMHVCIEQGEVMVQVRFAPEHALLLRAGTNPLSSLRVWSYNGLVARRGNFDFHR